MKLRRIFAVTLVVSGIAQLQFDRVDAQVVLGAKLGATFASIDVDPDDFERSSLSNFGGGGFLRFGMGGMSVQPEVLVLTKGTKVDDLNGDEGKVKLDYLEVPVFLRFAFGQGASAKPYVLVGPSVSFELGCDVESFGQTADCLQDLSFDRSKTDVGVAGGVGLEFKLGPGSALLEGRYTHGLTDVDKDTDKVRNRMFGVFVGYAVPLGSR
jgi:hypothetical protein